MSEQPAELVFKPRAPDSGFRRYLENWERYFFPIAVGAMIFIPVDMHPYLLPAMVAIVWSLVILVRSSLRLLAGIRPRIVQDIALPILTLLLWWAGVAAQRHSYVEAKKVAMAEARVVQDRCHVDKRCPERIDTWVEKPVMGMSRTKAGWTTRYWLAYKRSDDTQSFTVRVRRDMDFADMIHAGVGQEPSWAK